MTHEAGRQLDALIAEKVMGLTWEERRCRICGWSIVEDIAQGCTADSCSMRPAPQHRADEPAPYSTDLAMAWRVVEKIKHVSLVSPYGWYAGEEYQNAGNDWLCELSLSPEGGSAMAYGSTAPLAICLAALKAVGVE